jgi:hypothetical protein
MCLIQAVKCWDVEYPMSRLMMSDSRQIFGGRIGSTQAWIFLDSYATTASVGFCCRLLRSRT